jgi:hypothetical protein
MLQHIVDRARQLVALSPLRLHVAPAGPMAPYLGRRLVVPAHDKEAPVDQAEIRARRRARCYEVAALAGATFECGAADQAGPRLAALLDQTVPVGDWQVLQRDWTFMLDKVFLIHKVLPAPRDEATGEPMFLEVCATLQSVDGESLDSPAGQQWVDRQRSAFREGINLQPLRIATWAGSRFGMKVVAANYANIRYPGVGVPFYF